MVEILLIFYVVSTDLPVIQHEFHFVNKNMRNNRVSTLSYPEACDYHVRSCYRWQYWFCPY